jgi:hypothetical protein
MLSLNFAKSKKHRDGVMAMKVSIIIPDITRSAGTERAVCNLANILADNKKYIPTIISVNSESGNSYYHIHDGIKVIHCAVS